MSTFQLCAVQEIKESLTRTSISKADPFYLRMKGVFFFHKKFVKTLDSLGQSAIMTRICFLDVFGFVSSFKYVGFTVDDSYCF